MSRPENWKIEYTQKQLDTLDSACILGNKETILVNLEFIRELKKLFGIWIEERKEFSIPEPKKGPSDLLGYPNS